MSTPLGSRVPAVSDAPILTTRLPEREPGTALRVIATNDLLATFVPLRTTYGHTGTVSLIHELVQRERDRGPTVWLDAGDLSGGAPREFLGDRWPSAYSGVAIGAAAAGNHEFDAPLFVAGLTDALDFPLLCADRNAGLPPSKLIETGAGPIGVVGVSHPDSDLLSAAPGRRKDWATDLIEAAANLRSNGARWVVALWHNGVTWSDHGTRPGAWGKETEGAASAFDALLGGHTLAAWVGILHGVPAGQSHGFAGSVVVVDLLDDGSAAIHPPHVLDGAACEWSPAHASDSTAAALCERLQRWQQTPVGRLTTTLTMRPGAGNTLGDFVARAWLTEVPEADAAFVPACELWTQPPVDGTVAALEAGVVSELDLRRLFPFDDTLVVLEAGAGQFEAIVRDHDMATQYSNSASDAIWWNWARGRAGVATSWNSPRRIAMSRFTARLFPGAGVRFHPTDVRPTAAIGAVLAK